MKNLTTRRVTLTVVRVASFELSLAASVIVVESLFKLIVAPVADQVRQASKHDSTTPPPSPRRAKTVEPND
jgi:hypothetical protein